MAKIIYVARHHSGGNDDEGAITYALELLGHEVVRISEQDGATALEEDGDLLLFHKWSDFDTIKRVTIPKVFWYFDKVKFHGDARERWMLEALKHVDAGFLTDGTYAAENGSEKLIVLRQGVDTRFTQKGRVQEQYNAQVAFIGSLYGNRAQFLARLYGRLGRAFKAYSRVHQRNLANLCESVPILVAPPYPSDKNYWSNRVYIITGHGGFLLHPFCDGLVEEYEDSNNIVFYTDEEDMFQKIDYYLRSPFKRQKIRKASKKQTTSKYSYIRRCQTLISHIRQRNIGKIEPKRESPQGILKI